MNLELRRKAMEAAGWTIETAIEESGLCPNRLIVKDANGEVRHNADGEFYSAINVGHILPAIESDEGVAIRALVEWCGKQEPPLLFGLFLTRDWGFRCTIRDEKFNIVSDEAAPTVAESICNALIVAEDAA